MIIDGAKGGSKTRSVAVPALPYQPTEKKVPRSALFCDGQVEEKHYGATRNFSLRGTRPAKGSLKEKGSVEGVGTTGKKGQAKKTHR